MTMGGFGLVSTTAALLAAVALLSAGLIVNGSLVRDEEIPEKVQYVFQGDLANWEPPANFSKKFTYYLSGYDFENRPVWVIELGKWDIKSALESGLETRELLDKYRDKGIYRIIRSIGELDPDDDSVPKEALGILDMEGYTLEQLSSGPALTWILRTIGLVLDCAKFVDTVYVINANFFAETFVNLARPVLGKEFAIVEVYGSTPSRWKPVLRRRIPTDQLPEWYGGSKDFKPVRVFG